MTFDNATQALTHVISYPSVWLPPPLTQKILLLGFTSHDVDQLLQQIQQGWQPHDVAFYHVAEPDYQDMDQLHWIQTMQHVCDVVISQAVNSHVMAITFSLNKPRIWIKSQSELAQLMCVAETQFANSAYEAVCATWHTQAAGDN